MGREEEVPEPAGRPEVDTELEIVRDAIERRDYRHAVHHLGTVLRLDPGSRAARELFDRLIEETPNTTRSLVPDRAELSAEQAAALAYVAFRQGALQQSLHLLFSLVINLPDEPLAVLGRDWFDDREAASRIDPRMVAELCRYWIKEGPATRLEEPAVRLAQEPLVAVLDAVLAAHPGHADANWAASAIARRLGRADLAVAWAARAVEAGGGYPATLMLAYALREADRFDEAEQAFRRAMELNPGETLVRLDLVELLCDAGRVDQGLAELDRILEREPDHERAVPVAAWQRWHRRRDLAAVCALFDWLERQPDSAYGHTVARELEAAHPWVLGIPEPGDATVNSLRKASSPELDGAQLIDISVSHIESPSALLAFAMVTRTRLGEQVKVAEVQDPDPRASRRPVDHVVWRYDGLLPRPAVKPPGRGAAKAAATLAAGRYFPPRCRVDRAAALLRKLGRNPVEELLGLMVHPPPPPAVIPAWTWVRRVQALSALAIAQLDGGWHGSTRRAILLDLAEGPEDWVIEAALAALAMIAEQSEEARPEIVEAFTRQLVWHADHAGGHYVQSRLAAALLALRLPTASLPEGFTDLAKAMVERE